LRLFLSKYISLSFVCAFFLFGTCSFMLINVFEIEQRNRIAKRLELQLYAINGEGYDCI
jgi:hypothetical protein